MTIEGSGPEEQMWWKCWHWRTAARWHAEFFPGTFVEAFGAGRARRTICGSTQSSCFISWKTVYYWNIVMISADVLSSSTCCFLSGWSGWWPDEVTKKKKKNRSSALVFAFSAVKILVKAPEQIFSVVKQNSFPVFRGKSSGGSSGPTSSVLFHHFLKFLFHNELNEWMFWVVFFFFSWGD